MTIEKKKRGRPKKQILAPIQTPENTVSDEQELNDILNNLSNQTDFVNENNETENPENLPAGNEVLNVDETTQNNRPNNFENDNKGDEINDAFTELINPEIVISIFNTLIVFGGKLAFKALNIDGDHEQLNLSKDEIRLLKPSVGEWLKTLDFKLTPLTAMLLSVGMIYAGKIPVALMSNKNNTDIKQPVVRKPKTTGVKRGSYKKKTIKVNLGK